MYLAKPTGISLKEHTENVLSMAGDYIVNRSFVFNKYEKLVKLDIRPALLTVCRYHDLGKKESKWQRACKDEYDYYLANGKIIGKYLAKAKIRHEIFSVITCDSNGALLSEEEMISILAHHAKLSEKHVDKWEDKDWSNDEGKKLWKKCKQISFRSDQWSFKDLVLNSYRYGALRCALQFADKRASAKEDNNEVLGYIDYNYSFNSAWNKREVQKIVEQYAKDELLLLRAPTGAGKTDAALLWAQQQINVLKRADRLIIALPTRFTSNALALNVSDSISQTGLYHSTSKLKQDRLLNHFSKLLETPLTVCTIDHLLIALSKTKEDHHQIYFNLANACLVIDEADFYDQFTQANILVLLKTLKILQVPVLLMSASLPQSCLELYRKTGYAINSIKEDSSDIKRIRCNITDIIEYEEFDDITELLDKTTDQPSIIYVNTVDKAINLKKWYSKNHPKALVMLYHSRFTEADKIVKEETLLENLGKLAWENNTAKGIAILTQIGEMSINISADFMISDICPIDRLVQRAGRLSRFKSAAGNLIILNPQKDEKFYPAPYGKFRGGNWTPNESLEKTLSLIKKGSYSAAQFVLLVNKVYENGVLFSDKAINNSDTLRRMMAQNWLIQPNFEIDEDHESGYWQTRDMQGQGTIIVLVLDEIPEYLNNYFEFERFKNIHGISCQNYLIKKNLKSNRLIPYIIKVNEDDEKIVVLSTNTMYNFEYGLDLSAPDQPDEFL